jgi:hypothetical protein
MIDSLLTALTSHIIILLYMELSRDMPSKTDHLPSSLYVVVPLARPQSLLELAFLFEISSWHLLYNEALNYLDSNSVFPELFYKHSLQIDFF